MDTSHYRVIGVIASVMYTAPPLRYKYLALGEISVLFMWGPLMVSGAYFVQCRSFDMKTIWISIPFGILVALVLLANNIRDVIHDHNKEIATIAIVFGQKKGLFLYNSLIILAYIGIILMTVFGPLNLWSLIVLLSIPMALKLMILMRHRVPIDADARTAQLDTAFGALLLTSLILDGVF